jgi:hypothetical protein
MTTCMRGKIYIEFLSWDKRKAGREWVGIVHAYRRLLPAAPAIALSPAELPRPDAL